MRPGNIHLTSTPPRFAVRVRSVLAARCKQISSGLPDHSLAEGPKLSHHSFGSLRKLAPVFSSTYELFCTLPNANSHAFNQFCTLSQKHPGGGVPPAAGSNPPRSVVLSQQPATPHCESSRVERLILPILNGLRGSSRIYPLAPRVPIEGRLLLRGAL